MSNWQTYKDIWAAGLILKRCSATETVYLLLKSEKNNEWSFPKGHRDPGESLWATAVRECAEECGIGAFATTGEPQRTSYQLPKGLKHVVYWPAATQQESVTVSKEHSTFAWLTHEQVLAHLTHQNLKDVFCLLA